MYRCSRSRNPARIVELRWNPVVHRLARIHKQVDRQILLFVEQAVAFYPELSTLEYQDYTGVGARLVQA